MRKAEEEAKRKAGVRKAEEEAMRKAAEEAKRKAEEAAKRNAREAIVEGSTPPHVVTVLSPPRTSHHMSPRRSLMQSALATSANSFPSPLMYSPPYSLNVDNVHTSPQQLSRTLYNDGRSPGIVVPNASASSPGAHRSASMDYPSSPYVNRQIATTVSAAQYSPTIPHQNSSTTPVREEPHVSIMSTNSYHYTATATSPPSTSSQQPHITQHSPPRTYGQVQSVSQPYRSPSILRVVTDPPSVSRNSAEKRDEW